MFKWHDGDVYEGDWKEDKRTGKGICKYQNGDVYEGDFLNNNKHGNP